MTSAASAPRISFDEALAGGGELGARVRALDWSSTPLGPTAAWPQSLLTTLSTCLSSRFPILVWWGPELVMLYNDAYVPILGDKHPAALGRPGREVWPEIWHIIGPMLEGVLAAGRATWSENQLLLLERHGFEEECYLTFSYSPVHEESGRVGGVFTAVTETTGQVLGERRLRTLAELAARMAERREPVERSLAAASVLDANRADVPFALLYLLDPEAPRAHLAAVSGLSSTASPLAPAVFDLAGAPWPVAEALARRRPVVDDSFPDRLGWAPLAPGAPAPRRALILPLAASRDVAAVGVMVAGLSPRLALDERYQSFLELAAGQVATAVAAAQTLREARRRAEELAALDHAKTVFLSNVSHELRTPLTLILGPLADALGAPAGASREVLELAHRNAVRLGKLVDALLDFSRIEAGHARATFAPVPLQAVTERVVGLFRRALDRAGLSLAVEVSLPDGELAWIDAELWETVLLNLLSNAFKYTFEGGVTIRLGVEGDRLVTRVQDTGIGIPARELPRLFRRFHRVEGARGRTQEGTGIGLALVHELVKLHGGEVTVDSELGRGTTFTVSLPRGRAHLPPDSVRSVPGAAERRGRTEAFVEEALRWLPTEQGATPTAPTSPPGVQSAAAASRAAAATAFSRSRRASGVAAGRILLVDDNADLRAYLGGALGAHWPVEVVRDGAAGLAAARRERPALVITDVMMPGINGFELLAEIRSDPALASVPVIMLSARAGEEAQVEGLLAGADDYLVKPFSARELEARVALHLELGAMRDGLERDRAGLYTIFSQTPIPMCVVRGPELVIELANEAYTAVARGSEPVGRRIADVFPELAVQGFCRMLLEVIETGRPVVGHEARLELARTAGGAPEETYWTFVYAPLRSDDGTPRVLAVCNDVTSNVLARRELERQVHTAREDDRRKDEFLAMLGHELRNPLAPIQMAVELLQRKGAAGSFARELDVLTRQVGALSRLVDDLLDVSRVTRGKIVLRREVIDSCKAVVRAVEATRELMEKNGHTVVATLPAEPLWVDADPVRLEQVLVNLLNNAAKYTDAHGRIEVVAERGEGTVVLRVTDNGVGIPPDLLPRVFDLFAQGGRDLARSQGGLGVGLTIVRNIVELHGGLVTARSEGRGSELRVELPASPPPAPEVPARSPPAPRPPASRRVLVVDDNADAAEMLASLVRDLGHEVRVAHDGASALVTAESLRPDVVFLDIGLPGMDGYDVAQALRERRLDARLVAVTGYGRPGDRQRALDSGFAAHLTKPARPELVAQALSSEDGRS